MGKTNKVDIENVGVCIKSPDARVEFQNTKCIEICGNHTGDKCNQGCMKHYSKSKTDKVFESGFKHFKNINSDKPHIDAVMINDGNRLITFLHDKSKIIAGQLEYLKQFRLSKSETAIIEKFLHGYSLQDIGAQLFISRATLRTHLNKIYKKLPEALKNEIINSHLGLETK